MRSLCASILLPSLLLGGASALAAPPVGKGFGDWGIEAESRLDQPNRYFVTQSVLFKDKKQRLLKVGIGYLGPKGEPMISADLPLGVALDPGAELRVDDQPPVKLSFHVCMPSGCIASTTLTPAQLKAMTTAKTLGILALPSGADRPQFLRLSSNGLAEALEGLKE